MEHQAGSEVEKYLKRQYYLMIVIAVCSVCALSVVVIAAAVIVPGLLGTLAEVDAAMQNLNAMMQSLGSITDGLASITDELGPNLASIEEVTEGLQNLDFEKLNQAISDLSSVVAPLARLLGR